MRKHKRLLLALLAFICILTLAGFLQSLPQAQAGILGTSESFSLDWEVISSGGNVMTSESYGFNSTSGQVVIGQSSSPSFTMHSGYWVPFKEAVTRIFMPLLMRE
ncbi:MAG: hypothetical protein IBX69_18280 [Anaerolineales bacterium]|nr:hypothetical protein [Anaerolineales bacterium]